MKKLEKAFVIDDEQAICFLLSALLRKKGFATDYYTQLSGSISKLKEFAPDVIFLDLSLNDGSGFSIIPAIKNELPNVEIIIISAHSGPAERSQAKDLNIKYFIPKPLNKKNIYETLEQLI